MSVRAVDYQPAWQMRYAAPSATSMPASVGMVFAPAQSHTVMSSAYSPYAATSFTHVAEPIGTTRYAPALGITKYVDVPQDTREATASAPITGQQFCNIDSHRFQLIQAGHPLNNEEIRALTGTAQEAISASIASALPAGSPAIDVGAFLAPGTQAEYAGPMTPAGCASPITAATRAGLLPPAAGSGAAPSKQMMWIVICCEVAGKKTGGKITRDILVPGMKRLGLPCEVIYTERAGHAVELAQKHGSRSCGLIAVGGDGTIHEVMDGLLASGKLQETPLGLLSQGTVNAYYISAGLPDPAKLPQVIAEQSFRKGSLMAISDNTGNVNMHCFEAIYIGLGYNGTRGAQAWRNSAVGPMFGIIKANFADNLWPKDMAVSGTMDMVLKDGTRKQLKDTFYWIIVCMRNPYNGCLTDSMYVSYITLKGFPGFKRMVGEFLAPPFEFYSGLTSCFEGHFEVQSFDWKQTKPANIQVCLDGEPTDMGNVMHGEVKPEAWTVVAPQAYPTAVKLEFQKVGPETEIAARWIRENPPPQGVTRTPPGTKPPAPKKKGCC